METAEDFAQAARAFLDSSAALRSGTVEPANWGQGPDRVALNVVAAKSRQQDDQECREARAWRRLLDGAGFAWISGPTEYGGGGLPVDHERIFRDLEAQYDVPDSGYTRVGIAIVGPSIMKFGTEDLKRRWMRKIRNGTTLVCQLFSEPGAGSDLANTATKAVRDGDAWVVTGQKVWTSGGRHADVGECLVVTDPGGGRHKNLTMLLVDMHASGVDVRPLRQMSGGSEFCEVFLDEVRVSDRDRLGEEGQGWAVAVDTLVNERSSLGDDLLPDDSLSQRLVGLLQNSASHRDPVIRQEVVATLASFRLMRLTADRFLEELQAGRRSSVSFSLIKLALTRNMQQLSDTVGRILGPQLVADSGAWGTYSWAEFVLGAPGMRIGGGTDEIMRNIVGERVLGLPREPT